MVAAWVAVAMGLVDVHVHVRIPFKVLIPGLVRHPGAVEIEIPQVREAAEGGQTLVADRDVDQVEGPQSGERGPRIARSMAPPQPFFRLMSGS